MHTLLSRSPSRKTRAITALHKSNLLSVCRTLLSTYLSSLYRRENWSITDKPLSLLYTYSLNRRIVPPRLVTPRKMHDAYGRTHAVFVIHRHIQTTIHPSYGVCRLPAAVRLGGRAAVAMTARRCCG